MITETFELPRHWATALLYGEMDGFEDEDLEALEAFEAYMIKTYGSCQCIEVGSDYWFSKFHDASEWVLACDVSAYVFDITP